jgi:hypothetical protein
VQYPLILLVALGLLFRPACLLLLLIQARIFFTDQLAFRNHPYFFLLVLGLLALSGAGRSVSWSAALAALRSRSLAPLAEGEGPLTIQRLIQVQVCLVYVFAALHKLHPDYLLGRVLAEQFGAGDASWGPWFLVPSWITVAIELWLPFALWSPRRRVAAALVGAAFHLCVAWLMEIHVFSLAMVSSYLLFFVPSSAGRPAAATDAATVRASAARCSS